MTNPTTQRTQTGPETRHLTQAELRAEARERFGDDPRLWAFRCPNCGDVANGADFSRALAAHPVERNDGTRIIASDLIGQECIGRRLGVLRRGAPYTGRGCDWTAYGLFHGPWFITLPNGREVGSFPLAPVSAARSLSLMSLG